MKRKPLMWIVIVLVAFAAASLLSLYAYGRFAERARGPQGHALPIAGEPTEIDRVLAPLTEAHPDWAGLAILADNLDAFAVRAVSARAAGRSLDLQYYIWHPDLTGNLLHAELLNAADRGVRVRLLLDDMNVHGSDSVLAALDTHPGIEVRLFNPTRAREGTLGRGMELLLRFFSVNRRMHNKAWIADGRLAVVGGRNIGDEYFDAAAEVNFMDTDVAVVGPPVAQAEAIFDAYWNSASAIPLDELVVAKPGSLGRLRHGVEAGALAKRAEPYRQRLEAAPSVQDLMGGRRGLHWTADATIVSDPPEKAEGAEPAGDWMGPLLAAHAGRASRELKIISPYFVPGEAGVEWIAGLRGHGVEVGILTNSLAANDVVAVHGGYARYRVPLLEQGVSLFELKHYGPKNRASLFGSSGASLHTKAFVADRAHGFIGSFNLDPRSINLNTEMGLLFDCADAAAELDDLYAKKTSPQTSYRLELADGSLRWHDPDGKPPRIWRDEPHASWSRRALARVVGWLPVESQL
ncbi:MAG: phospholipase D family protein [Proteobacteria bacterium]|nr:phospholipase D family protein [Pseudomonadota bacterium]